MVLLCRGVQIMKQEQVKLRLDEDIKKISEIYHDTFHKSRNQFIQDAYEQAIISDLMSSNPMEPVSADMIAALENLLNTRIKRIEEEQAKNQWLIEYIAAHRIVSNENIHEQLTELENQIAIIDNAVQLYGSPRIEPRAFDILKTRLTEPMITKCGKMFVELYQDKRFKQDYLEIYNELISLISSEQEQGIVFGIDPTSERNSILFIVDTFYRKLIDGMIDGIHQSIDIEIISGQPAIIPIDQEGDL